MARQGRSEQHRGDGASDGAPGGGAPARRAGRLPRGVPYFAVLALAVVALLAGGAGGVFQGKLSEVQQNDNTAYLPASAESTVAGNEAARFSASTTLPGFVVFHRDGRLTAADRAAVQAAVTAIRSVPGVAADTVFASYSADGTAAAVYAPLIAKQGGTAVSGDDLSATENAVIDAGRRAPPAGLQVDPAGPAGLLVAFIGAFAGLDGTLLYTAGGIVVLILLLVYRSPVLWFFPLFSAVLALGLSAMVVYALARSGAVTLTGQSQGILSVLVLGAGTDYALLLISRYREELHRYERRSDAMIRAWRQSAPAIFASGATVIIGVLCLSFSELNSNKSLGPVSAIGIACTLLVMTTFLPVALALAGRWVFWPRRPTVTAPVAPGATGAEPGDPAELSGGLWGRIAGFVGRHARPAWITALVLLAVCLIGLGGLNTGGLSTAQGFTNRPDAVVGQEIYDARFPRGTGAPAVVVTDVAAVEQVRAAAARVPGVSTAAGSVCVRTDPAKLSRIPITRGIQGLSGSPQDCPPPALQVTPIDGRTVVDVVLADAYDSPAAFDTVARLRAAVHAVPGADALVGGTTAADLDVRQASVHDRNLIIPIVLAVILVMLALLLRAVLAPVLLVATVVLSFLATLGVCGWLFGPVFGFAGADQSFPLFAFVFLVALGIDYNIFLMTRVREETLHVGTRRGVLRGLAVTGGVITSAGVVLAATFAVLGVLPLVFLAELGFAVAFGVLLDTLLVRTVLVPALVHDIGRAVWWPSRLSRGRHRSATGGTEPELVTAGR
ncbi:MMPL family transporter [Nakamurella endophytica]|uniref:Membrane protein n=1 Tax=Nakamurella endophytica TaxID=1748367 RepID=A0A917WH38_9ACTN|nr:MMPL family transporter [Nakamurella endophytica]GGM02869.1 membrane protein [Nakamurella endophytica]